MATYKVADGHDVAANLLTATSPQPKSEGIKTTRRSYGGDNSVYDEGKYIELEFTVIGTATQYQTLLTAFGVNSALTNEVTVLIPNETFTFVRMNGTAVRPEPGREVRRNNYFIRNVVILVKDLEASA